MARKPGQPGQGQLGPVNLGQLREHLGNPAGASWASTWATRPGPAGRAPGLFACRYKQGPIVCMWIQTRPAGQVQLAIATGPGPADQGRVSWTAATAGQGSWDQA
jgi:hypothetical protein